jgi:hypothetical protein
VEITRAAEKRCQKLRKGRVAFSTALQQASRKINSFLGLLKRISGRKFSSQTLQCSIHRSGLPKTVYSLTSAELQHALKDCYTEYFSIKWHHKEVRANYLDNLAKDLAESQNLNKANMLKQLREREEQRNVACCI